MDEFLNEIVNIENKTKVIINDVESKKENIDDLIEEELSKEKNRIDVRYNTKIEFKEREIEKRVKEQNDKIENDLKMELERIQKKYNEKKQDMIDKILNNIYAN